MNQTRKNIVLQSKGIPYVYTCIYSIVGTYINLFMPGYYREDNNPRI